ncbi:MAG: lysylphosphatidylglycerol synthase transmembrane domain-containing protein [Chitinophagaceae bacterium]
MTNTLPVKKRKIPGWLKLGLKIIVSAACLWYVSGKIDFTKAGAALRSANWLYLVLALAAFVVSKWLSALRLNIYFRNTGLRLPEWTNTKLYWLGMFYNLLLPGSISGDAYKVILLTRRYQVPYRKTTAAVLLDRFSGLLGLALILAAYGVVVLDGLYTAAAVGGALLGVAVFYFIVRRYLADFLASFFPTLFWGLLVQGSQVVCTYLIMAALGIPVHATGYVFIFLVSSVAAVLPLTVGGLGIREIVFLEGSRYFSLVEENSVIVSILFYLITLFTSLWGLLYVFRDPLKTEEPAGDPH